MKIICFHLNQVGDLAFSLPALKCLRDSFRDAHITSVARPNCCSLLTATGLIDNVLPRNRGINLNKLMLAGRIMAARYDLAVVFSQSADCAVLAYLSGAKRRVGFVNTSLGSLLTEQVSFTHPPSTQNNLNLIAALGCEITSHDYSGLLKLTEDQCAAGDNVLARHGISAEDKIVAFAPGTSDRRSVKEWTDEGYAKVGRHLIDRGYKVVVLGTIPAVEITSLCESIVDLSAATSLDEAAGILNRCLTLVAVDSGMLHLAAALGKKVVGLYGPSNWQVTGPQGEGHKLVISGEECSPCMQTVCKFGRKCMTNIDVQEVISCVESIIAVEAG
ncbi:glycosyltransferase family 9 protein [bacterium]|nr:glycosyltransferase family 9 protein [bacterium]